LGNSLLTFARFRWTLVSGRGQFTDSYHGMQTADPRTKAPIMRIRTASDAIYSTIAWLPMLVIAAGIMWVLAVGVLHLEINSFGTEFFVSNAETSNRLAPISGASGAGASGDAAMLQAALDSGDPVVMGEALDGLEQSGR
jgi:hypothetical protein